MDTMESNDKLGGCCKSDLGRTWRQEKVNNKKHKQRNATAGGAAMNGQSNSNAPPSTDLSLWLASHSLVDLGNPAGFSPTSTGYQDWLAFQIYWTIKAWTFSTCSGYMLWLHPPALPTGERLGDHNFPTRPALAIYLNRLVDHGHRAFRRSLWLYSHYTGYPFKSIGRPSTHAPH